MLQSFQINLPCSVQNSIIILPLIQTSLHILLRSYAQDNHFGCNHELPHEMLRVCARVYKTLNNILMKYIKHVTFLIPVIQHYIICC